MRKWSYAAIAGGLGLILTMVLASCVARPGGATSCSEVTARVGGPPLGGGKQTSVTAAQSVAGYQVLIPDVRAARLSNLGQTWVNQQRYVVMIFAHGKVTIMMAPAIYANALQNFQRFIRQNHVTATIGHVRRQPALVITPDTDSCGSNPAWVEFEHSGIDINVYSRSYGTSVLLSVANSLKQQVPWHAESS